MNRQMAISVLVRLVDRLTGPIERVMGRVRALGALGGRIGDLTRRLGEAADKAGRLAIRIGALGTIGAGLTFAVPIQAAAKFDAVLRDLAITSGTTSATMTAHVQALAKEYESLALKVGQRSGSLAEGAKVLIGANVPRDVVAQLMPKIGRATTAAGADITDMSKTTVSLIQNLKIAAEQMESVFAGLVVAGKEGRFELRDMARAFPKLTGHMANLGVTGTEAAAHLGAALQVAMRGVAEPMQAAGNMENFLSKLLSKETIKNFEEKGIDIKGVMDEAVLQGINPVEAALKKILGLTGMTTAEIDKLQARAKAGGITDPEEISRLSERIRSIRGAGEIAEMFGDMEVKNFLIPMLAGVEDFKAIKEKIVTAMSADPQSGPLADDFRSRMAGLTAQLDVFAEVGEQAMRRVGTAFATHLGTANAAMERLLASIKALDERFPGMIDQWLAWGGAALLVVAALGILGPAIWAVSQTVGLLWAVLRVGVLVVAALSRAFVAFGAAMLTTPVGWVIAGIVAIATAAYLIWQHWEPIKAFFAGLWTGITTEAERVWTGLTTGVQTAARLIGGVFSAMWTDVEQTFRSYADRISAWWDGLIPDWARGLFGGGTTVPGAAAATGAARAGASPATGPSPQKQEVGGKIVVKIDGPGRVESVTSDSRAVPIEADRGPMLAVP